MFDKAAFEKDLASKSDEQIIEMRARSEEFNDIAAEMIKEAAKSRNISQKKEPRIGLDRAVLLSKPVGALTRRLCVVGLWLVAVWVVGLYLIVRGFFPIYTTYLAIMTTLACFFKMYQLLTQLRTTKDDSDLTLTLSVDGVIVPPKFHPQKNSFIAYSSIKRCLIEKVEGIADESSELVITHESSGQLINVRIGSSWFGDDSMLMKEIVDQVRPMLS